MIYDFPASPALNDTYPSVSPQWKFNGIAWLPLGNGSDQIITSSFDAADRDQLRAYLLQYVPTRGFVVP